MMATPPKTSTTRKSPTRRTTAKKDNAVTAVKDAVADTVDSAKDAVSDAATSASDAVKTRKTPARRTTAKTGATKASTRKASTTRTKAANATSKVIGKAGATVRKVKDAERKSPIGLKTIIATGIGAVGAVATAALLTLRSSTPKASDDTFGGPSDTAKQADGTDASKSFAAGIADEGSVPQ